MILLKRLFFFILLLVSTNPINAISMKVGDTETLDIGNIEHLQGCQWTISRPYDVVFTTKPQSFSTKVTIKAINAFSAQSPCIVQCKYYYLELDPTTGRYTYSRTGYKDWTVFVNKSSDNGDNSENDGSVSDYIVGDLLKFTSKEGAYMEFQVTGTEPLNRTCELSGISKDYIGEVTIPSKVHGFLVTKIKKRACWQCIFKTVNIPFSVKIIEDQGFSDCENLRTVKIEYGMMSIGNQAFQSDRCLESIELPNSIVEIGEFAFSGCTSLNNILLPSKMETIKRLTFNTCRSLQSIELPEGLKRIEDWAFNGCKSLEKVILPSSLKYLGEGIFYKVKVLVSLLDKPFATGLFHQDFFHVNLYVPYGTKEKYMNTAGWNSISSRRIFEITNSETAIRNCVVKSVIEDKGWTIDGIKVSSNMDKSFNKIKGIYIKGGKKILMK